MTISRRAFLNLSVGGLVFAGLPRLARAAAPERIYLGARADDAGAYRVSAFDGAGQPRFDLPLPERGHGFALRPGGTQVTHFARRPGDFALVIDLRRGAITHRFSPAPGRHFYGHGAYSADGALLYVTENAFVGGRGVVGVYDAREGYRRIDEFDSGGVGPHELRLLPDGRTLAVANGGIRTHPDMRRMKLNLPDMRPSFAYLDAASGELLEQVAPPSRWHQCSIRHFAVAQDGTAIIGMQYQGPKSDSAPLVAVHQRGQGLRLLEAPRAVHNRMRQYCGSVAVDVSGRYAAVSAPRGGLVTFWDVLRGEYLRAAPLADGCGVAAAEQPGFFMASSGRGGACLVDAAGGGMRELDTPFLEAGYWDNHLTAV